MTKTKPWSLNRALVLLIVGGFLMLLVEIRYEHREVLAKESASWVPLLFSGAMAVLGVAAVAMWRRGGRSVLQFAFAASLLVGLLGVWFHTEGHPLRALAVLTPNAAPAAGSEGGEAGEARAPALVTPASDNEGRAGSAPGLADIQGLPGKENEAQGPPLAPLAFVGMGLMGLVATSHRFRSDD